eukprot:9554134-Alexandrium_andersonii.AAC.1
MCIRDRRSARCAAWGAAALARQRNPIGLRCPQPGRLLRQELVAHLLLVQVVVVPQGQDQPPLD